MKSSFFATKIRFTIYFHQKPFFSVCRTALEIIPSPASRPAFFAAEATPFYEVWKLLHPSPHWSLLMHAYNR